jgi:mono/diheme cytochrome c family protein
MLASVVGLAALQEPVAGQDAGGAPATRSVWQGVFTEDQAAGGRMAYEAHCSRCHGDDLTGRTGGSLVGERFERDWSEDSLASLFNYVKSSMPRGEPGSLPDPTYVDIVAYMLQRNGFPSGHEELQASTVNSVRVEAQGGPKPVPNYSLVRVVGCLKQDSGRQWTVTGASEPIRTRNPAASEGSELADAVATRPGAATIELMDVYPNPDPHSGRLVEVKGFLIRLPNVSRLNVTSLQKIGESCGS